MPAAKVLFVDDDERVLNGIHRQLGQRFDISCAVGPARALELLSHSGPFAVVVSDMRMPGMTGIEFLAQVRNAHPDTVRIMLTGQADLKGTIAAVNEGHVFCFLTKPCSADVLERALTNGLRQYQLVISERELVQGTLMGSVKVLSEMLSLMNPAAFGRAARVQRMASRVGAALGITHRWELEIAALLSHLGCVTVPVEIVDKVSRGERLSESEAAAYEQQSEVACKLIRNIPRLETVAELIRYQAQHFDGSGFPGDGVKGEALPLEARILHAVLDLDRALTASSSAVDAFRELNGRSERYDPKVLATLEPLVAQDCGLDVFSVKASELVEGMYFAEDVLSTKGILLVTKGQEVTAPLRIKLIQMNGALREPLSVSYLQQNSSATA